MPRRGAGAPVAPPPPELTRSLGLLDATMVGFGAIIGAGIFVSLGVAAGVAGPAVLLALLVAAVPATLNALSSAALSAALPRAGGTYHFGRELLGPWAGFAAGWSFLAAKLVSGAVMVTGFGRYLAAPGRDADALFWALGLVVLGTLANLRGARWSARINVVLVLAKVAALLVFAAVGLAHARPGNFVPFAPAGWNGVWEAAALLFGAYAGYARIATLSEEVVDPRRTLPRAIGLALGGSALLYLLVAVAALALVDAPTLARSAAPLADALRARQIAWAPSVLAAGALVATASVFLTLLTGTSRVFFAMARNGDLPRPLAALDPSAHTPRVAVLVSGVVVAVLALTGDLRALIEAGSAAILFYYALTNAAALRLAPAQRGFPAVLAVLGLLACLALMAALPVATLLRFAVVLGVGLAGYAAKRRLTRSRTAA